MDSVNSTVEIDSGADGYSCDSFALIVVTACLVVTPCRQLSLTRTGAVGLPSFLVSASRKSRFFFAEFGKLRVVVSPNSAFLSSTSSCRFCLTFDIKKS